MFRNKQDKQAAQNALKNDAFYFKIMHQIALFNQKDNVIKIKKEVKSVGKPPLDWRIAEKVFREKGEDAKDVAITFDISIAKVYKIWQEKQPSHIAYLQETGKEPLEDAEAFVEWIKKEGF
jgi:hypothetical protein